MIDLRSDTATNPTAEMRATMAAADVGDEQLREDPTVNELQRRAADLLGQEEALFLPTATMANQIALFCQSERGGELIAEERTHVLVFEAGGPAVHSGLITHPLPGDRGRITPDQLRDVVRISDDLQPPSVVVLEQTHRSAGGRVWPLEELAGVAETARELGLVAPPGRRALAQRLGRERRAGRRVRQRRRLRHALLLEGSRLPARRDSRRAARDDG